LPQTERSQEGAKGREGTDSETEKKPSREEQKVSGREGGREGTGEGSSAREVSGSKVKSAKEAVLRDPKVARKDFEQKIADKALSNAKKNPRSDRERGRDGHHCWCLPRSFACRREKHRFHSC
jgi:hypothetical protein